MGRPLPALGLGLWQLAGGFRDRVPVYDTEGGWLHLTEDELVGHARQSLDDGLGGVKIKIGKPSAVADRRRLAAVRDAVGDELDIMVDANQSFTAAEAIRRSRMLADLDVFWFEEPLPADDIAGHARLASLTTVPIAVGESLYAPAAVSRVPPTRSRGHRSGRRGAGRRHHAVAEGRPPG